LKKWKQVESGILEMKLYIYDKNSQPIINRNMSGLQDPAIISG